MSRLHGEPRTVQNMPIRRAATERLSQTSANAEDRECCDPAATLYVGAKAE
jgi:hypothetical protein